MVDQDSHNGAAPVVLCQFRDQPEAAIAKSVLDAAGIECFLADATIIRMDWLWSNAVGGIKLLVKKEDVERATELLARDIPTTFDVEGVGEYRQPLCPACQSTDISLEYVNKPLAAVGLWIGIPITVPIDRWRCQSCGHVWKESPNTDPSGDMSS